MTAPRFFAPEVVQSSAMDCGPASLKCLLEGFCLPVSYGRLREACQTDVDGSSIDMIEEVAAQLGLEVEQTMIAADQLLLPEAGLLPALVVTRQENGSTHFLVVWSRHGPFVQVMDPAVGRRWLSTERFLDEVHVHTHDVAASDWREWAGGAAFVGVLTSQLQSLGLSRNDAQRLVDDGLLDPSWRSLARLDAVARMLQPVVRSGALPRGERAAVLESLLRSALNADDTVPDAFWAVRPAPSNEYGEERLLLTGAVLMRVLGRRERTEGSGSDDTPMQPLSVELAASLQERPTQPGVELLRLLRRDGILVPALLILAISLAASTVIAEALLLRGLLDLGRDLSLSWQRIAALSSLLLLVVSIALLDWSIVSNLLRIGRRLETRLRIALFEKLPRLRDRYFTSRLMSDMAERGHMIHVLREVSSLGGRLLRRAFELLLTTAGIIWLDPASAPLALAAAFGAVAVALLAIPLLNERDLKVRSHVGALSRFYLDALLGLVPIRAHAGDGAIRREHRALLQSWAQAAVRLQKATVSAETALLFIGFGSAAWLLFDHLATGEAGRVLLLVYWALKLPALAEEFALCARQYPAQRNRALRLFEPLNAPERVLAATEASASVSPASSAQDAVAVAIAGVDVRLSGHLVLSGIDLQIAPGRHVAIVGPSGAGKSTLVGLLLGWYEPAAGSIRVDGDKLGAASLDALRARTAWVDPDVQLWNRSLADNLLYGSAPDESEPLGFAIETAELREILEGLPEGLRTRLGESGALVAGGEGQRVRFARALRRRNARLVILDEPFRGLARDQRRNLLSRARRWWSHATLICITHDVGETLEFDEVIVMENGSIAERGPAAGLAARTDSRFAAMLEAERDVRERFWSSADWAQTRLEGGKLVPADAGGHS